MQLFFNKKLANNYTSKSQKVRVLTEDWVNRQIYCANCGRIKIDKYENSRPVADFFCPNCKEDYELKAKKEKTGNKIVNGAYKTMIERLQSKNNPNFFLLNYNPRSFEVLNFFVIPKHFFVPQIIEKRKPLSQYARRSGWIGCNILLQSIPQSGKIFYVKNRKVKSKEKVLENWNKTLFLRESGSAELRGWILDIMNCIDKINKKEFSLQELYNYENDLKLIHPNNKHIKDKIRQQLQFLRNKGYLEFKGNGKYKMS